MSLNIQTATGLLEIGGRVTKEKVISALGYEPANKTHAEDKTVHVTSVERETWNNKSDVKHYDDLEGAPSIAETDSGNMVIADESGNIIMQVDADGLETTNVNTKSIKFDGEDLGERLDELESMSLPNILDNGTGDLTIADESGNVIVKIDESGLETTAITVGGKNIVETIDTHISDNKAHVTEAEKKTWNDKSDFSGFYADLPDAPNIQENNSGEVVYADESGYVIAKINENGFETTQVIADTILVNGSNVEEELNQINEIIDNIEIPSIEGLATEDYVDEKVANLVNSAPETLDTLNELADALGDDPNFATTVANQIGQKANQTDLDSHTSNKVAHITADERATWNAKSDFSGDYNDLENAPNIQEDNSNSVIYADQSGNIIAKIDANGFETTTVTAKNVVVNGVDVGAALDDKAASEHTHDQYLEASDIVDKTDKSYVDEKIAETKTDASNKDAVILVEAQKSVGVVQTALDTHADDGDIHITADERISWNNKSNFSGNYNDLIDAPTQYYVTPQMFGAVANGVTDDTDAFLEAAAYCVANKKTFYVPEGKYLTNENCVIANVTNIEIDGYVTNLTLRDNASIGLSKKVRVFRCDNLTLRDYINSYFQLGRITNLTIYANTDDVSSSAFAYNYLVGGQATNFTLEALGNGWINENTFERIRTTNLTINKANNNKFYDVCLEHSTINILRGHHNYINYRGEGDCTVSLNEELDDIGNPLSFNNVIEKTYVGVAEHFMYHMDTYSSSYGNIITHADSLHRPEKSVKRYDIYNMPFNDNSDFANKLVYTPAWLYYGDGIVLEPKDDMIVRAIGDQIKFEVSLLDENFDVVDPTTIKDVWSIKSVNMTFTEERLCYTNTAYLDEITASVHKTDSFKYVKLRIRSGNVGAFTTGAEIFVRSMRPARIIDLDDGLVRSATMPTVADGVNSGFKVYNSNIDSDILGWEYTGTEWKEFPSSVSSSGACNIQITTWGDDD